MGGYDRRVSTEEMSRQEELEFELKAIKHDLEHVTHERDKAEKELKLCLEVIEAMTKSLRVANDDRDLLRRQKDAILRFCGPKGRIINSKHINRFFNLDPVESPIIDGSYLPPEYLLGVANNE